MFIVRLLGLMFLAAYGFSMGQLPPHELNGFGKLMAFSFFITAPALYLLPTFEAWKNQHSSLGALALLNVFLGWSLLGWVAALVWAFKKPAPVYVAPPSAPPVVSKPSPEVKPARETKACPFCAEDILVEAIKCKHCGSNLASQT